MMRLEAQQTKKETMRPDKRLGSASFQLRLDEDNGAEEFRAGFV